MKEYQDYSYPEFLSDPDFRQWVIDGRPEKHPIWPKIPLSFPGKADAMLHAAELIEELFEAGSIVSARELDDEVKRILDATAETPARMPSFRRWYWSAAAAVLAGLMIWFLKPDSAPLPLVYQQLKESGSSGILGEYNASDSITSIRLPDGSLAKLYPGALLKYPADGFGAAGSTRDVYMTGDIFFDIARDTTRPFFVYTDGFVTRVVGTSFLVRASEGNASVEVKSGKVIVRPLLAKEEEEIALTPNQRAIYTAQANQLTKDLLPEPEVIAKVKEELSFDFENTPISEVFAVLEKAYGIPIVFDPETLGSCYLSVRMDNEPFYSKLAIVCKTIGADYEVAGGEVLISGEGCR